MLRHSRKSASRKLASRSHSVELPSYREPVYRGYAAVRTQGHPHHIEFLRIDRVGLSVQALQGLRNPDAIARRAAFSYHGPSRTLYLRIGENIEGPQERSTTIPSFAGGMGRLVDCGLRCLYLFSLHIETVAQSSTLERPRDSGFGTFVSAGTDWCRLDSGRRSSRRIQMGSDSTWRGYADPFPRGGS